MAFKLMPDMELLAMDALRFYMAGDGVSFVAEPQRGWAGTLPFCVVYRVSGVQNDVRMIDESLMSVSFVAETRAQTSLLARRGQLSLAKAAADNFANAEGSLSYFHTVKSPVVVHDGLTGKHTTSVMFDATYRLVARALY